MRKPNTIPPMRCIVGMLIFCLAGCAGSHAAKGVLPAPTPQMLGGRVDLARVDAICQPPAGWTQQPLEEGPHHTQQVWISPSGATAYGVIHMRFPFPVGQGVVLWAFMNEMRRSEKEASLLERTDDPALPGIRFVAEGGLYRMRINLVCRGSEAWAIYTGIRRDLPLEPEEVAVADKAREATATVKR